MATLSIGIEAIACWAHGVDCQDFDGWVHGNVQPGEGVAPALKSLPPVKRRRLNALGRAAFHCAQQVCGDLQPAGSIFISDHGELTRSVQLLRSVVDDQPLSPNQFSLSVHNAIAGLYSIFEERTAPTLALSAGSEGLGAAFIEAAMMLETVGDPILLVAYDEPVPMPFAAHIDDNPPVIVAGALRMSRRGDRMLECVRRPAQGMHVALWDQIRRLFAWLADPRDALSLTTEATSWTYTIR
jgi:hypothetical protein